MLHGVFEGREEVFVAGFDHGVETDRLVAAVGNAHHVPERAGELVVEDHLDWRIDAVTAQQARLEQGVRAGRQCGHEAHGLLVTGFR